MYKYIYIYIYFYVKNNILCFSFNEPTVLMTLKHSSPGIKIGNFIKSRMIAFKLNIPLTFFDF